MYKCVIRPVLLYGAECWAVGKEEELASRTEMRKLRWILGVSRREKKRNEEIRKKHGVANIVRKMREARLLWFGHMMKRDEEEAVSIVQELVVEGERGLGQPKGDGKIALERIWWWWDWKGKMYGTEHLETHESSSRPQESGAEATIKRRRRKEYFK